MCVRAGGRPVSVLVFFLSSNYCCLSEVYTWLD